MLFKRRKLFNRLLVITLTTTLLPLFVTALYLIPRIPNSGRKLQTEQLYAQSVTLAHVLDSQVLIPLSHYLIAYQATTPNVADLADLTKDFAPFLVTGQEPVAGMGTSEQGMAIVQPDMEPSEDGLQARVVMDSTGRQFLLAIAAEHGKAVARCLIDLHAFFQQVFKEMSPAERNCSFLILDKKQQLVVYSSPTSPPISHKQLQEFLEVPPLLSQGSLFPRLEFSASFAAGTDLDRLVSWRILAIQPEEKSNVHLRSLWFTFFGIVLFALVLASWGTYYYWQRIAKPLENFARSATEIARGNFDQKIATAYDDEIGRVARIFNYMVVELRRLQHMNLNRIIAERTKTKTIIKNIADGIIVTDQQDRVVTINVAMEKWFRITESEVVERPLQEVFPIPDLLDVFADIRESRDAGMFEREIRLQLKNEKRERYFQIHASKMLDQEEKFAGIVAVLRDITREKEIDQMKTELVSMVAHQLRSPLTSISGFAELLLQPDEDPDSLREYATVIHEESGRLAEMVNKFLDISKIEAGRIDFRPETIKAQEVLDNILYLVSAEAQKKDIQLAVQLQEPDLEIYADSKLIAEVIINLLTNAIKYSPERTMVTVSIKNEKENSVIQVADQGYGIAAKHLPNIFRKFYRIKDDPRVQEERGTGLGLSLVKEIVELHRGEITVESEIGKGTTFTILIPKRGRSSWMP